MIAKARVVSHGAAYTNYATLKDESVYVGSMNLDGDMTLSIDDNMDFVWDEFRDEKFKYQGKGKDVTRTLIAVEASPSADESQDWTIDDWWDYAQDLLRHVDALEFTDKNGKVSAPHTDLMHSKVMVMLHTDSVSGIKHMHIMASRFTVDGRINNGNLIGMKFVTAANQINKERGWKQPEAISKEHKAEIKDACYDVLRWMPSWDLDRYLAGVQRAGYRVEPKRDSNNNVVSYAVYWGNSRYRACDIGANLTVKKLKKEWESLHPKKKVSTSTKSPSALNFAKHPDDIVTVTASWGDVGRGTFRSQSALIPKRVYDFLMGEATPVHIKDGMNEVNVAAYDVMKTVALLFAGYVDAATSYMESFGGGGSSPSSGWGKDDDEDEKEWLRRCLMQARVMAHPAKSQQTKVKR